MFNNLRALAVAIVAMVGGMCAQGQTVQFTTTDFTAENFADNSYTKDGVTITISNVEVKNSFKPQKSGGNFTISSTSAISEVVLTTNSSKNLLTCSEKTFTYNDKIATWTGTSSSLTFTNTTGSNIGIEAISVSKKSPYSTTVRDYTSGMSWDFSKTSTLWEASKAAMTALSDTWSEAIASQRWELKTTPTQATGYAVDIIEGLRFQGGIIYLDSEKGELWVADNGKLIIPSVPAGYRVIVESNNGKFNYNEEDYTLGTSITVPGEEGKTTDIVLTSKQLSKVSKITVRSPYVDFSYNTVTPTPEGHNTQYTMSLPSEVEGTAKIKSGEAFVGIPGLSVTLGASGEEWQVADELDSKKNPRAKAVAKILSPVKFNSAGIPVSGCFYAITPSVSGELTLTGLMWAKHNMMYKEGSSNAKVLSAGAEGNSSKVSTKSILVNGGTTYYFYSSYNSSGIYQLMLQSIKFEPSFLLDGALIKDGYSLTTKPTIGSTTDVFPSLSEDGSVKFESSNTSSVKMSGDDVQLVSATDDNITITATFAGTTAFPGDKKLTYIIPGVNADPNLYIAGSPSVGEKVTDIDGMIMTWGGWQMNSHKYNRYRYSSGWKWEETTDSWSAHADGDYVKKDGYYGGLLGYTSGARDGKSETYGNENDFYGSNFGDFKVGDKNSLPVRGAYATFEPTKNGTLSIYILQNGCINTFSNTNNETKANDVGWTGTSHDFAGKISWRPFYIVDEAGEPAPDVTPNISAKLNWSLSDLEGFVADNSKKSDTDEYGNATEAKVYWDNLTYNDISKDDMADFRKDAIKAVLTDDKKGQTVEIIKTRKVNADNTAFTEELDGGYMTVQKAYVLYELPVKVGKTYYIFSNSSTLGLCGFKFVADAAQSTEPVTLDNKTSDNLSETNKGKTFATATLAGRKFTAGQWTTLCLPFSVSASQMRVTFGDEVQLIEARTDSKAPYLYLVNHVNNQTVVAGVPYLLKPAKSYTAESPATISNGVYFPATPVDPATHAVKFTAEPDYQWTGTYANATLKEGDHYVSGTDGKVKYYSSGTHNSNSYRSYLDYTGNNQAKVFSQMSFESGASDVIDGIERIEMGDVDAEALPLATGVYNLQGQKVAANTLALHSLPSGIYVVNGRKVVVK